jgi:hypothetical protein
LFWFSFFGKGFIVHLHVGAPSLEVLAEQLATASQVWVISNGGQSEFKSEYLDLIEQHWRDGLGLYIFGDNVPYFVEGNQLIERCFGNKDLFM